MRPICLLMVVLTGGLCAAQNADAPKDAAKFYKLDFVVKDLDGGKAITAKSYSIIVKADNNGRGSQIRAGSKVSIGGEPANYLDVGTNIDCSFVTESHDELGFRLDAEVSSVLSENDPQHPVIRQNKWSSIVTVPMKKPTVVFSSDDNTTKRVIELEVTVTPRS